MRHPFGRALTRAVRPSVTRCAAAILGLSGLVACDLDSLLQVGDPDAATEESVMRESALPVLYAGALRDFQLAYTGFPSGSLAEGVVLLSGLLADEYDWGDSFDTRREIDIRNISTDNATAGDVFARLHRARVAASRAASAFESVSPEDPRRAELQNLAGMTFNFFGEIYCSGVPFSDPTTTPWKLGTPTPTPEIFQLAIARFDLALAVASASETQRNLARLGKARALLNLDQPAQAAALAALVPTSFRYELQHSENTGTQNNGIWAALNNVKRYRIADRQGGNGLPYRSSGDPRITWFQNGAAFDTELAAFSQSKYPARPSSVWPAEGIEARLIEAEAALRAPTDLAKFVQMHNELRARVQGLAPLTLIEVQSLSATARQDLHFRERAFWLWQTGHRLGDMRRLIRQYGRNPEQVFPTGQYFKGGSYGSDVNVPIPVEEQNNPNFTTCLNRAA